VENEDDFPPIKVVVVEGKEDLTIKISDEGGGIPRSAVSFKTMSTEARRTKTPS
jgi:signal transduction histidine kinase